MDSEYISSYLSLDGRGLVTFVWSVAIGLTVIGMYILIYAYIRCPAIPKMS